MILESLYTDKKWGGTALETNFEKLVPGFYHGQTVGIQMVHEILAYLGPDMKRHNMRWNQKTFDLLFNCIIANRLELRENPDAFIRCTNEKGFELHVPASQRRERNDPAV